VSFLLLLVKLYHLLIILLQQIVSSLHLPRFWDSLQTDLLSALPVPRLTLKVTITLWRVRTFFKNNFRRPYPRYTWTDLRRAYVYVRIPHTRVYVHRIYRYLLIFSNLCIAFIVRVTNDNTWRRRKNPDDHRAFPNFSAKTFVYAYVSNRNIRKFHGNR